MGKKRGIKPFDKLKVADLKIELHARGASTDGIKPALQKQLVDILSGTVKLPALIHTYNTDHTNCLILT